jgi:cell division septum initiation protein DivIVA
MGFLDKVKEQAEKAKAQAQDLKVKVGDKVEEVQGKRKADDLLGELGRFLYAERTGRTLPSADAEIQRLVAELEALEAEGVFTLPTEPSSATAETAAPEAVAPEAVAPEEAAAGGPPTA